MADSGYPNYRYITPNTVSVDFESMQDRIDDPIAVVYSRHETLNERLKTFNAIRHIFIHRVTKHCDIFHAVFQLTALMISTSDPLFDV